MPSPYPLAINGNDRIFFLEGDDSSSPAILSWQLEGQGRYLASSPDRAILFRSFDLPNDDGASSGWVESFRWDRNFELTRISQSTTEGSTPCHLAVHPSGRMVAVANFRAHGRPGGPGAGSQGSVSIRPVETDGQLSPHAQTLRYPGSSVHPERQTNSHPHMVAFDPSGQWLLVPDLGLDRIHLHRVLPSQEGVEEQPRSLTAPVGSGPRHAVFHPSGRHFYVVTEMGNTILRFTFDPSTGEASLVNETSAQTPDGQGGGSADIGITPDGRTLCSSLRRDNLLAVFPLDLQTAAPGKPFHQHLDPTPTHLKVLDNEVWVPSSQEKRIRRFRLSPRNDPLEELTPVENIPAGGPIVSLA